jgi:hypothetical protein
MRRTASLYTEEDRMPTPAGFADISVQITLAGLTRPAFITFGVDPTSTTPSVIATAVNSAITSAGSLASRFDSQVTLPQIRVSYGTDGGEDLIHIGTFSTSGSRTATCLPANCALLVHKITQRGGRRGRGRMFLPWYVDEPQVDEAGIIAAAELNAAQSALNAFLIALGAQNVPMYLLHGPGDTTPGPPNEVTQLVADKLISTQRRRLGR